MGWGRWLLLGDLGQQLDLSEQQAEMEKLRQQLRSREAASASTEQRLSELRRDNDELKLYLAALVRLLVSKKLATTDEIKQLVAAIDREDGTEDKRYSGPIA